MFRSAESVCDARKPDGMTADERRLNRLRRLERVRAIAKRQLAAETAVAESALAQLRMLTERTSGLANDYSARKDAFDGL